MSEPRRARKPPAAGARKRPAPPRAEPEGFAPAEFETAPVRSQPSPRPRAAGSTPPPAPGSGTPGPPTLLTDLLRGPLQMVGQVTGIDSAARSMERLSRSAERAADLLDRLDREVGLERIITVLERLERLSETADQMNRSLRAVEKLAADVQKRVIEPLDRLPLPRALLGRGGGTGRTPGKTRSQD